ncbi:hypothetical protein LshimejAT787_1900010, partial [Lyophyllum shimeji]
IITDIREDRRKRPWVVVKWYYSPEDLLKESLKKNDKMIVRALDGSGELILSNHEDVIDPSAIESPLTLIEYDDHDPTGDYVLENFWFSRLEVRWPKNARRAELPALKGVNLTCVCQKIYLPSTDVQHFCGGCDQWYHAECLEEPEALVWAQDMADPARLASLPIVRGLVSKAGSCAGTGSVVSRVRLWLEQDALPDDWRSQVKSAHIKHLLRQKWTTYQCPQCGLRI